MAMLGKYLSVFMVIIIAFSSTLIVKPINAQSTKPLVPEFTISTSDNSYDVPPTYAVNNYTGKTELIKAGYHVQNYTVAITIKNQMLTDASYYNISVKGHFSKDWDYLPFDTNQPYKFKASNSAETVILLTVSSSFREGYYVLSGLPGDFPAGGTIDFRVQALAGSYSYYREDWWNMDVYQIRFSGIASDWSDIQALTIADNLTEASPSPTVPEFPFIAVFSLFIFLTLFTIFLKKRGLPKGL